MLYGAGTMNGSQYHFQHDSNRAHQQSEQRLSFSLYEASTIGCGLAQDWNALI